VIDMTEPHRILTENAPTPMPMFSQGVRRGPILQVSGQGGADPVSGAYGETVAEQTTRTLLNVKAIVEAGGASFADVVMLRVYLTEREHFAEMNEAYAAFMAEHNPGGVLSGRTTVFVTLPLPQMLVEIDALAVVD
jgi:reactive intermediate/imine deaminase